MADKYDVMTTAIQNSGVWMPILATTIGSAVTWWTARGSKKYAKQAVAETVVGNAKMEAVHGAVANAADAAVDASHNAVETAMSARQAATESTEMIAQALQANYTAMNQHTEQIAALQKQVANLAAQFSPSEPKP